MQDSLVYYKIYILLNYKRIKNFDIFLLCIFPMHYLLQYIFSEIEYNQMEHIKPRATYCLI